MSTLSGNGGGGGQGGGAGADEATKTKTGAEGTPPAELTEVEKAKAAADKANADLAAANAKAESEGRVAAYQAAKKKRADVIKRNGEIEKEVVRINKEIDGLHEAQKTNAHSIGELHAKRRKLSEGLAAVPPEPVVPDELKK